MDAIETLMREIRENVRKDMGMVHEAAALSRARAEARGDAAPTPVETLMLEIRAEVRKGMGTVREAVRLSNERAAKRALARLT